MLIKCLKPVQRRLGSLVRRSYYNYPYFDNRFSCPPDVPEYFLVYNDIFVESRRIERRNMETDEFSQKLALASATNQHNQAEYYEALDGLKNSAKAAGNAENKQSKTQGRQAIRFRRRKKRRGSHSNY